MTMKGKKKLPPHKRRRVIRIPLRDSPLRAHVVGKHNASHEMIWPRQGAVPLPGTPRLIAYTALRAPT